MGGFGRRLWVGLPLLMALPGCGGGGGGDDRSPAITDFQVQPSPAAVTATPGDQAQVAIDVPRAAGFTAAVSLSLQGLPAGATASFSPVTLDAAHSRSTLTLSLGGGVAAGTYGLTVAGSGGGTTHSAALSLTVAQPTRRFALSVAPSAALAQGSSGGLVVGIQRGAGFRDPVTLSLDRPPAGLGFSADGSSVTASASATFAAGAGLAPGTYALTLRGTAGTATAATTLSLRVVRASDPPDRRVSRVELGQTVVKEGLALVGGKRALVRAYVLGDRAGIPNPGVRLSASAGGSALGTLELAGPGTLPTAEEPSALGGAYTGVLPAAWVQPGLVLKVELDPAHASPDRDPSNDAETLSPQVNPAQDLEVVVVPVASGGLTGQMGSAPAYRDAMVGAWPLREASFAAHAPLTFTGSLQSGGGGWEALLQQLDALRQAENPSAPNRYYYGLVRPSYRSGVVGLGYVGYPAAVGWDDAGDGPPTMAHEEGHNLGRLHAPCRTSDPDPDYPYAGANLGTWGWSPLDGALLGPASYVDLMGYCSPPWVSDYSYQAVQGFLRAHPPAAAAPSGPEQDLLLVAGRMDGQGRVELRPLLRLRGRAPASAGGHALRLEAAGGVVEVPFEPRRVADWPGGELWHFTVLAPDPGPLRALELRREGRVLHRVEAAEARAISAPDPRPELRESGGQLELRWDAAAFPQASVARVGPEGRTVLGLWLEGGRALLSTAGLPPGGRFELSFARGLQCVRLERPR